MAYKKNLGSRIFDLVNVGLFIIACMIMLFPFWNVIMTSLVSEGEYFSRAIILWPHKLNLTSYKYIFSDDSLIRSFFVTVFETAAGTLYSMLLTTTLAYGLSKKYLPGRNIFLTLIVFTMFFGGGLIPFYFLIRNLHLINNIWVLILPVGVNVWYFILVKAFFTQIPDSIEESAKIDGANDITIFFRLILPLSLPTIATFSLFYGVAYWNQWYFAVLFLTDTKLHPLQMLLRRLIVQNENIAMMDNAFKQIDKLNNMMFMDGVKMATVIVSTIPILLVYPLIQRYFTKGIMLGSVKE